jgi:hypothetical protein
MKAIRKPRADDDSAHFDAVAWTRQRRDAMYAETRDMSPEELVVYVRHVASREDPPSSGSSRPA